MIKNISDDIQAINDQITQEIRINRVIKAEINRFFLDDTEESYKLFESKFKNFRSYEFVEELLEKYYEIQERLNNGEKVPIGEISALLKSIEVEEKYVIDRFYKSKAHCFISYLASEKIEKFNQKPNEKVKTSKFDLFLIFLCALLIIFTYQSIP